MVCVVVVALVLTLPAEVRLDNTGPGAAGIQTAVRGLRRAGPTTRWVSIAADGSEPNEQAYPGALSEDGRYVAFQSKASNLVPGDTNRANDVFVHDGLTGVTSRVSVASDGTQMGSEVGGPVMSADGRHVAFLQIDVFVHDRVTGETTQVSVATDGTQGDSRSYYPAVSADGRYVAFRSVPGDTNGQTDVFVHDRATGATTRASVAVDGAGGNDRSYVSEVSADGRHVAFGSVASNLVPGDTNANGEYDVYVRDGD